MVENNSSIDKVMIDKILSECDRIMNTIKSLSFHDYCELHRVLDILKKIK